MEVAAKKGCDVLLIGYEDEENLGLRSIAAFLNMHDIRTRIEPYDGSSKETILKSILRDDPKIVGFSLIFQRMLSDFAALIAYLRKNNITAHFTMGGHFPTLEIHGTLWAIPELDSIVRHEGEQTLLQLFNSLNEPDSWMQIRGLVFRKGQQVFVTPPRPLIRDLDSLPYPVRGERISTHRGIGNCSILASRGCYFNCSFCSIQNFYQEPPGPKRRTRSPSNVAQEMEELFHERAVRIFVFKDDDLCTKGRSQREWVEEFARELKKRKLADNILWRISSRVDEVDAELLGKLRDVGLVYLYMGIESGNNQGLKTFNKHYTVDAIPKALGILEKLGIDFEYGFMMFDPDSSMSSVKENIAFLRQICEGGKALVHFTKMFPYVGTSIALRLKDEGRLRGTIESPDYSYNDPRLDLLQLFFSRTFRTRIFERDALVNKLQRAKFDAVVLSKFFPDKYDSGHYSEAVKHLVIRNNDSALETMSFALSFMESRGRDEIISNWHVLEYLSREDKDEELRLTSALNRLLSSYHFGGGAACV